MIMLAFTRLQISKRYKLFTKLFINIINTLYSEVSELPMRIRELFELTALNHVYCTLLHKI